jgi:DNA processing protein
MRTPREEAIASALTVLPQCGIARLRAFVQDPDGLEAVWSDIVAGRVARVEGLGRVSKPADVAAAWRAKAATFDLDAVERRIAESGVRVLFIDDDAYPQVLRDDPDPPGVLFIRTQSLDVLHDALARPRVAIIGTRRCTNYGVEVSRELGRDLSAAGVVVVSGLALGIDGAAHEGALVTGAAPPVGVVGSGLDVVYPHRHRRLWASVADAGALISEAPLGAIAEAHRFPQRNRIIAGLSDLVIVVESHAAGGSMHTVQAAIDRGVPVMAVPGSVRSKSSAGTNRLLAEGVAPVLDVDDVLVALALERRPSASPGHDHPHPEPQIDPADAGVLAAVEWTPTSTETVLERTGLSLGAAAAALTRLEMAGAVRSQNGWWERKEEVR